MQSNLRSVLPIAIRGKRMQERKPFQLIMPCTMDVNARNVNDYIGEAVVYVPITWILYRTELGLSFLRVR